MPEFDLGQGSRVLVLVKFLLEIRDRVSLMLVAKRRKAISITLLALMLFAQTVYAVDACVDAAANAARAVAAADMPDCETMKIKPSCLSQCNFDSQSSAHPLLSVPPIFLATTLILPEVSESGAPVHADFALPAHWGGPAPPIQFCRFLL